MAGMKWMIVKEVEISTARSPEAPTQKIYYFLTKLWEEYIHDPIAFAERVVPGTDAFWKRHKSMGARFSSLEAAVAARLILEDVLVGKLIIVTEDEQYGRSFTP